jgi:hypothetical protein
VMAVIFNRLSADAERYQELRLHRRKDYRLVLRWV